MRCSQCHQGELEHTEAEDTIEVAGHTFTARVPALRCAGCGEIYYDGPSLGRFELAVAVALVRSGQMNGQVLRFARKVIGLSAKIFAELLGVAPETVSRWENGKQPIDLLAAALLGAMVLDEHAGRSTAREALQAVRDPHPLGSTIELDLAG
jgi:putative zinc finger/helix-turn-helix YgiT family protein